MNDKILKALRCDNHAAPPVWIMRQAGRYLPSYRALRQKYSLDALFHQPELAAQVTQLPFEHLPLDAAILFSDILVIAEVFGLKVHFPESGGPMVTPVIKTREDIVALTARPVEEALSYVFQTIGLLQGQLSVPLLGFAGAPFTVATYLMQGEGNAKALLYRDPQSFHLLLAKLTEATIAYLKLQVQAGVKAVQIFDSWANVLSYSQFMECSAHYLQQIVQALDVPVIVFCRGSSSLPAELAGIKPAAISFDWQKELSVLRKSVPSHIAVQGNLDPQLLKATPEVIEKSVKQLLASMKGDPGFIMNLGHGILPDTPLENVQRFVAAVRG